MQGLHLGEFIVGLPPPPACNAEPQRASLQAERQKFSYSDRLATVKVQLLRYIADARPLALGPSRKVDTAKIGQVAQESQQQSRFTRPVGADDGGATAPGHGGADRIQDAQPAAHDRQGFEA